MYIKQISVFLENKPGQLAELVRILADNNIDIQALSLAESNEYGVLRIIVDDAEKTKVILEKEGWMSKITNVVAVTVEDKPGSFTKILDAIASAGISLLYSYAFYSGHGGNACMVLRSDDDGKLEKLLSSIDAAE